jgi:hypothetical protein
MKQGSVLSPRSNSIRVAFATWWIYITIVTSFYTANLTAFLTLAKFSLPINEPQDLLRLRHQFICQKGFGFDYSITNVSELEIFGRCACGCELLLGAAYVTNSFVRCNRICSSSVRTKKNQTFDASIIHRNPIVITWRKANTMKTSKAWIIQSLSTVPCSFSIQRSFVCHTPAPSCLYVNSLFISRGGVAAFLGCGKWRKNRKHSYLFALSGVFDSI